MKQKIKRCTKVILFCFLLTLWGCTKEEALTDDSLKELQISEAKSWFTDYKTREVFHPIFTDINYHWEDAAITVLEDGSKAVTVPITDPNLNPEYKGQRVLYLYPFEEGYDALVYELSPDSNQTSKGDGFQNLDSYNGLISTWDLKKGFIKAQKFANSAATEAVAFKVASERDIKLLKLYPKAIQLETVIIEGSRGGGGIDLPYSYITSLLGGSISVGGSNTDNYFNPPYGGSSGGTKPNTGNLEKDPCDKIKKLIESILHKRKVEELKKNFKLQYETGYYISKTMGYVEGTAYGSQVLNGKIYPDTYGVTHVHIDTFTHMVNNGGIRPEVVKPIPMFSPKDINTLCSLLLTTNKYKTSSSDEVFNEMISSSGTYQLRFDGDINNVKNFDYDALSQTYVEHMEDYKNNLESGLLVFIKDYIGIDGITLYKINDDGTSDKKTLSQNGLSTTPCDYNNIKK